ncbi:hypothetical protein AVEN_75670-1 [Araneus ventricosus]|uniref:Uncharacterized protein n=1 Tax=Araneus ventricosus TaxID=182803 RepID=A0A4Y2D823_ARAVE|nr:hypothetical protein AVEN_75670-1 [Araneus ventricosus]
MHFSACASEPRFHQNRDEMKDEVEDVYFKQNRFELKQNGTIENEIEYRFQEGVTKRIRSSQRTTEKSSCSLRITPLPNGIVQSGSRGFLR